MSDAKTFRARVKPLVWKGGKYGFTYGFCGAELLYSIDYDRGSYRWQRPPRTHLGCSTEQEAKIQCQADHEKRVMALLEIEEER